MANRKEKSNTNDRPWAKIFRDYDLAEHDFDKLPYNIDAEQIKKSTKSFTTTGEREVRVLCKHDTREKRPEVFKERGLFILPTKNGEYAIVKGEGYVDIPKIENGPVQYCSKLDYELETSKIGNSEMQYLDYAYASSLLRTFLNDDSLVLTIRGRKYTPVFSFKVGSHSISVDGVQTEVDAGYEGRDKVVLVEAKNSKANNTIIRQLYYPYKQWQTHTKKKVYTIFFEQSGEVYSIWQFEFADANDYNSIRLVKAKKYKIKR